MQEMNKWFERYDAAHLLHDASIDSLMNEVFLQCQCIMTLEKCQASCSTHYNTYVATNYKIIFFPEQENHKDQ